MWTYVYPDELYHHGVKGQKWGVRRYQNKDGSLTPAGKKRIKESGTYMFPAYDRQKRKYVGSTKNRFAVEFDHEATIDAVWQKERDRLMSDRATLKKAGYKFVDKPDSDIREHNNDILDYLAAQSPAVKAARRESIKRNIDKYADATIADLGLANTKQTKDFVKEYLTTSSTYVYSVLNDK